MTDQVTPAEFSTALADAERSRAADLWGDHVLRHGCITQPCPVRLAITRLVMALDELRNTMT